MLFIFVHFEGKAIRKPQKKQYHIHGIFKNCLYLTLNKFLVKSIFLLSFCKKIRLCLTTLNFYLFAKYYGKLYNKLKNNYLVFTFFILATIV
jgi:hypothetical protein